MIYEGKPFICSHAVSLDYKRKLRSLCDEMIKISTSQLMDTYRSGTIIKGQNIDYQKQLIYNLKDRFSSIFNEKGYDLALYSIFKDKASLDGYQVHPEHLKVKEFVHSVITDRAVVDFEF